MSKVIVETAPTGDRITSAERRKVKAYFEAKGSDWIDQVLIYGAITVALLGIWMVLELPRVVVQYSAMIASMVFMFTAYAEDRGKRIEALLDRVAKSDFERAQILARGRARLKEADLRDPKCCAFLGLQLKASEDYGNAFVRDKVGKDERTRWTPHEITNVWVGREQLWIHQCAIDLSTGAALYERTRELFFCDILTVVLFGKMGTYPMPPKHSKAVKASLYWGPKNAVVLEESLQIDGLQTVSLSLVSGEELLLATWLGARDKGQPADAVSNREAALRLRTWVEWGKRSAAPPVPDTGPRVIIRPRGA